VPLVVLWRTRLVRSLSGGRLPVPGGAAMTSEEWIERYRRAWETADGDEIVDLFTYSAC
jgi:hypothetical protein